MLPVALVLLACTTTPLELPESASEPVLPALPEVAPGPPPLKPDLSEAEIEALRLLLGETRDGRFDPTEVDRMVQALAVARAAHPALADIPVRPAASLQQILIELTPEATTQLLKKQPPCEPLTDQPSLETILLDHPIGLPHLDVLNEAYGVSRVELVYEIGYLFLHFERPVDTLVLSGRYASLPGVRTSGPDRSLGDGSTVYLVRKPQSWHFVFYRGAGDCPSGCIEKRYWYVTYDPATGRATFEGERANDGSDDGELIRYGIPPRFPVLPFKNLDDLLEHMSDPRWWAALHAVSAGGLLIRQPQVTGPWVGEDRQDEARFLMIKGEALGRQVEVATALAQALRYPDTQVQDAALDALRDWRAIREGLRLPQVGDPDRKALWARNPGGDEPEAWAAWVRSQQP